MTARCGGGGISNTITDPHLVQTLAKVVQELDKTLFDSYIKPKSGVVTSIVRGGILDGEVDWYETPQPNGITLPKYPSFLWLMLGF